MATRQPSRSISPPSILWVLKLADAGVPICLIAGPQFFMHQNAKEKASWHSPEFIKRIKNPVNLPNVLDVQDLKSVASIHLPEADDDTLELLALVAIASKGFLAEIVRVATRVDYIAKKAGRNIRTNDDIQRAIEISNESTAALRRAIEGKPLKEPPVPAAGPIVSTTKPKAVKPAKAAFTGILDVSPNEANQN